MSSPKKSATNIPAEVASNKSSDTGFDLNDDGEWCKPDFIYGGPFIKVEKPTPFLDIGTPVNMQLQGTFKRSFAYYSLKERLPVILTKIIDFCSRESGKVKASGASDAEVQQYIRYVSKLKNDLVTNKKYSHLQVDSPEAKKWNEWIDNLENAHYFTNTWVFSECYVYRRLREGCELGQGLKNFDPFEDQKQKAFNDTLELMCIVAEKLVTMLPESEKDKRKADFITLLKICLWANKCDLSLTAGEPASMSSKESGPTTAASASSTTTKGAAASVSKLPSDIPLVDPFQMIIDFKDKLLVDDTAKVADQVVAKAESMAKAIEGNTTFKYQCSCHRLATLAGMPKCPEEPISTPSTTNQPAAGDEGEEVKIPCPAKITIPSAVMFDIVCDNAGYELFSDLCLAHFLVSQKIVQKVRFHVKKMPWFVSDVTPRDFKYVIDSCSRANFSREVPAEPKPAPPEGEAPEPEPPRIINADSLRQIGDQWNKMVEDGTFMVMCDDYWTCPHVFKDMKQYDYNMYRKLQYAIAILFKGDLNYRKLLGEKNCNSTQAFEPSLQGFIPAPIIAVRTVKADLICGLPKGKYEQLNNIDENWMRSGDYGVIQFCPKAEALKVSEKPCVDYGDACRGVVCPTHTDI